jgi:glycine dehydrogenase subunit 2
MLKAWAYIKQLGAQGIAEVSEKAVLNANYLRVCLKEYYNLPKDRICMHEFVINDKDVPNGVTTNDIAKRILDYGYHAPTVYFPLIIEGAIMIEPTETESKETLDAFVKSMKDILNEAKENPDLLKNAPQCLHVGRVDAVSAARNPVLKWEK